MKQSLALVSLVVPDYDEAIAFYVGVLGFRLVEDTYRPEQDKRWVVVAPPGSPGPGLLLARATNAEQATRIGNQAGGRVFLFLQTDDFDRDFRRYTERGVEFVRPPKQEDYGKVAVFRDPWGNLWDLLQPSGGVAHATPAPGPGTLTGACLCGRVRFTVTAALPGPDACHCVQCRRQSGHYFVSTNVPRSAIAIDGLDGVTWFQSSAKVRRGFCATCGSALFWDPPAKDWIGVAMGAFDAPTGTRLEMHIHVAEKGDYYEITDDLPQHPH